MKLFELFATLALDTKDFATKVNQTGKQASGFASTVQTKMSAATVAMGNLMARGVETAARSVVKITQSSLNAVKEYEQNLGGSEAVFGKWASTVQGYSKTAFKTMGLSMSDYLSTANKMGSLFKGAGFETSEAMDMTSKAMQRAADVASIMGVDAAWAMESIAGLAKGNFTMMDNLGVAINETTLANYALEKGIKKTIRSMTTQEKIGLALELFMERTAEYAGNYAKENTTLAGSYEVLSAAWTNMLIGAEGSVDDLLWAAENAAKVTLKNLGQIIPRLGQSLWKGIQQAIPKIKTAFVSLWNNDLPGIAAGGANLVISAVNAFFGTNFPKISKIELPKWEEIEATAKEWWAGISESMKSLMTGLSIEIDMTESSDDIAQFGEDVSSAVSDAANAFSSLVGWVKEMTGLDIASAIPSDPMKALGEALKGMFTAINPLPGLLMEIVTHWNSVKETVKNAIDTVTNFFSTSVSDHYKNFINTVSGMWDGISSSIRSAINAVSEFFGIKGSNPMYDEPIGPEPAPGGYATGLGYVPYNNFPARLHEGEAVLTKAEATEWRKDNRQVAGYEIDYDRLGKSVAAALVGVSLNMDGQTVGRIVAPTVSREIATSSKARRYT